MLTIKDTIKKYLLQVIKEEYGREIDFQLEYPRERKYGDYATNAAMILAKELKTETSVIARRLIDGLRKIDEWKDLSVKEDVAGSGFINIYLGEQILRDSISDIIRKDNIQELNLMWQGKKYLLEHTSANPVHTIHIGHLLNNFTGMAVARLLRVFGAQVDIDYIDNDRGTGVARAMIGYLIFADKRLSLENNEYKENLKNLKIADEEIERLAGGFNWREAIDRWDNNNAGWFKPEDLKIKTDYFDLCVYSPGARAAKKITAISDKVQEILLAWEEEEPKVRRLWRLIIDWSMAGYKETLTRLGSETNYVWHESEIYSQGKEWVKRGLEKGIFKKLPDGAVISNLESYGLSDLVLQKANGAALYPTQDLELTARKIDKYGDRDQYIWCVGKEQELYLKQIFQIVEQLGIASKDKLFHLKYGFIRLKTGKMKSSLGTVVNADDLMEKMKKTAQGIIDSAGITRYQGAEEKDGIAEKVMIAALKYGLLKYTRQKDFEFNVEESLSLDGNSGPYLQYTYARARSIIAKSNVMEERIIDEFNQQKIGFSGNEKDVMVILSRLNETLLEAASNREPQIICDYLYRTAKNFNSFYEKEKIIGSGSEELKRLAIVLAVGRVLSFGLAVLGIETMERM